ncbi:hypothetical protein JXB22_07710 [candidate division WOR-3 bacterium]|nr:hypothetical protein [candidate division WOR-3 bacterium]
MKFIHWSVGCLCAVYLVGCSGSRPFAHITAPADSALIGGTVDITAQAAGIEIARVEFFIDGEFHAIAMHPPYSVPWETHTLPDSSRHIITAKVYDRSDRMAVSDPVYVLVDNSQGKPRNTLNLVSARINNEIVDVLDPLIEVNPGADITGDITVRANNRGDPSWGAPLGGTPTWGDHVEEYWETGIWLPEGISEHTIDLFLQAPDRTGTYSIFIAWAHETDCSHVMALSYWQYENSPEWNDGYDIADWTDEQAQMAIDSGYVRSTYRYDASGYGIKYVPAVAVRVRVQ